MNSHQESIQKMKNGISSGITTKIASGVPEKLSNGVPNGVTTNGSSNGVSNGVHNGLTTKATNGFGSSNGAVNGSSNGVSNGTHGRGPEDLVLDNKAEWGVVEETLKLIGAALSPEQQAQGKVTAFKEPTDLKKVFDVELKMEGNDEISKVVDLCHQLVSTSVATAHPLFLNQLFKGADPYGTAAALLITALNANAYTYEVAPAFTLIEHEVVKNVMNLIGFPQGDGIMCPGGSIANMYGLSLARFHHDSTLKEEGLFDHSRLCIFTSAQSHYSVMKAAAFMGFGTKSVIKVNCDRMGSMDPKDLDLKISEAKQKGQVPVMLWVTSGTTILSAFDPISEVTDIAKKHGIWVHVDACLGGAFMMSKKHRKNVRGIERADSVAWNWHKMLGAPLLTSVFVTSHTDLLKPCHSASASYLFMKKKYYDNSLDLGDASIQCGRLGDAVKIWLMWKARGISGFEKLIDHTVESAEYMASLLEEQPEYFKLVLGKAQGTGVCFWVTPKCLRGLDPRDPKNHDIFNETTERIKKTMVHAGNGMVTYQPLPDQGLPNFFRCTLLCHPPFSKEDCQTVIKLFVDIAKTI